MEEVLGRIIDRIVKTSDPEKIILFGSRCRGQEGSDSDYDLLVLKGGINSCRALAQEIYKNIADIPAPVDIIVETPEKIEKYRNTRNFIYLEAAKGRVIYER